MILHIHIDRRDQSFDQLELSMQQEDLNFDFWRYFAHRIRDCIPNLKLWAAVGKLLQKIVIRMSITPGP